MWICVGIQELPGLTHAGPAVEKVWRESVDVCVWGGALAVSVAGSLTENLPFP